VFLARFLPVPQLPQRLPAPGAGHPGRDDRAGDPEAAGRVVLPVVREHRRRAERALASVVAARYLLGVLTRRVGKLAVSLGEPPGPITSDVPRSRPIVEKSVSAGQMIQEPSPAGGSLTAVSEVLLDKCVHCRCLSRS